MSLAHTSRPVLGTSTVVVVVSSVSAFALRRFWLKFCVDMSLLLQISRLSTVCDLTRVAKTSSAGSGVLLASVLGAVLWSRGGSPQPIPISLTCSVGETPAGPSEVPSWPTWWAVCALDRQ